MHPFHGPRLRPAFTLVQAVVALAVVGILTSVAVVAVPHWKARAAGADLIAATRAVSLTELTARTFGERPAASPDASAPMALPDRVEPIARWSDGEDWGVVVTHAWDRRLACVATASQPTPSCGPVAPFDAPAGSGLPTGLEGTLTPVSADVAMTQWPLLLAGRAMPEVPTGGALVVADARALLAAPPAGALPPGATDETPDPAAWITWRQGATVLQSGPARDTSAAVLVTAVTDPTTPVELWVVSASGRVRANGTEGGSGGGATPEPFVLTPVAPVAGEPVLLDGHPVRVGTDSARAWNWTFGTTLLPASSSVQNLVRFPNPGSYAVRLSTRLQSGQVVVQTRTLIVGSGGGIGGTVDAPRPRAVLSSTGLYVAPNQALTLSLAASTTPAAGGITSFRFLNGAGAAQTGASTSFTTLYRSTGSYTALGIITDAAGAVDTARLTITVAAGSAPLNGAASSLQVLPVNDRQVGGEPRVVQMVARLIDVNGLPRGGVTPTVTITPLPGTSVSATAGGFGATSATTGESVANLTVPSLGVGTAASWALVLRTGGPSGPVLRTDTVTFTGVAEAAAPVPLVGRLALTSDVQESTPVVAGQPIAPAVVARLRTLDGTANLAQAGVAITAIFQQGNGTLTGATALTDGTGQAVFPGLTISGPAGTYQLSFSAEGYVPVASRTFALTAALAGSRLSLTQQPALTMVRGQTSPTQPTVRLLNADGSPAAISGVSIAALVATSTARGGTTLVGATAVTNGSGIATFSSLRLNGRPGLVTLRFAANGYQPVIARSIDLVAPAPFVSLDTAWNASLAYGQASAVTPVVTLRDTRDRVVGTAGSDGGTGTGVTITVNPQAVNGDLTVQPLTTTTTTGVARLVDFRAFSTSPVTRTVSLKAPGFDSTTAPLTVTQPPEGGATGLRWQLVSGAPSSAVSVGTPIGPVVFQLVDASNQPVAAAGYPLWLGATSGRSLTGQDSRGRAGLGTTDGQGRVSLGPVSMNGVAGETQLVTRGRESFEVGVGKSLPSVIVPVTLVAGPPTTATRSGASLLTGTDGAALAPLTFQLRDASGNLAAEAGASLMLTATGGVTFSSATAVTDAAGTATMAGPVPAGLTGAVALSVAVTRDGALVALRGGAPTFTAPVGGLSLVGTPVGAVETRAPTAAVASGGTLAVVPQVQLRDAGNRAVPMAGVSLVLSIDSTGTDADAIASTIVSGGTAVTDATGTATFTGLVLRGSGTVRLRVSAPSVASLVPSALATRIRIAPAPVTALAITTAPTTAQVDVDLGPLAVELRDATGTRVPELGRVITLSLDPATGWTGTLSGLASRTTDAAGRVTFTGLRLIGPAPASGAQAPRLVASLTGATSAVTAPIPLAAGAHQTVTLLSAPDTLHVDVPAAFVFQVRDMAGNPTPDAPADYRVVFSGGGIGHEAGMTSALVSTGSGGTGQATFVFVPRLAGLTLTGPATVRSLTFVAEQPSCIGCPTPTVTVSRAVRPGPARQIAVTQQPASQQMGAPIASALRLTLHDASGNPAAGGPTGLGTSLSGQSLTIGVATDLTPGRSVESLGAPSALSAITDASGVATFPANTLRLVGPTGVVRLLGQGQAPLVGVPGAALTTTAGAAATLQWVIAPPARGRVGVTLPPMSVRVVDSYGNVVPSPTRTVTIDAVEPGYSLTGATASSTGSGTAGFASLTVAGARGLVTLRASAVGLTQAVAPAAIDLSSGAAAALTLVRGLPETMTVDAPLGSGQTLQVQLVDLGGFPVYESGRTLTLTLPGSSSIPAGRTVVTNANGLADFGGTRVRGVAPSTLTGGTVTDLGGLPALSLAPVSLVPGAATQFTLLAPVPTLVSVGQPLSPALRVQLRDVSGNATAVAGRELRFYAPDGSNGAQVSPTPIATALSDASGIATFTPTLPTPGLPPAGQTVGTEVRAVNGTGGTTPWPGFNQTTAVPLTVSAGVAANLEILSAPAALTVGAPLGPTDNVVVQLRDPNNNPVAQGGVTISVRLPGGLDQPGLSGAGHVATAVTDGTGRATVSVASRTYTGLAGTRFWVASASGYTDGSQAVSVSPGAGAALRLVTPPSDSAARDLVLARQPVVEVIDAGGNRTTSADGQAATIYSPTAAVVTLLGSTTVITDGLATFTGLALSGDLATYDLAVSAMVGGQLQVVAFPPIVLSAGAATQISWITSFPASLPTGGGALSPTPVVQLRDAGNNPTPQAGVTLTVNLVGGPGGTLSGTTSQVTDAQGRASFPGLTLTGLTGTHILEVSSSTFSLRDTVTIAGGAYSASQSTLTISSAADLQASNGNPNRTLTATVRDASGNPLAGQTVTFSALGTAATGVGFSPISGVTDAGGQITASVWSTTTGDLTLRASVGGVFMTTTPQITVTPAAIAVGQTLFTLDATTASSPTGTFGRVRVRDVFGNDVPGASVELVATPSDVLAPLGAIVSNASGQAVFTLMPDATGPVALQPRINGTLAPITRELTAVHGAPAGVASNLLLWLRADRGVTTDGSNNVTSWQTQAAPSVSVTGTPGANPAWVTDANGKRAVRFESRRLSLPLTFLTPAQVRTSGATLFMVSKPTNPGTTGTAADTLLLLQGPSGALEIGRIALTRARPSNRFMLGLRGNLSVGGIGTFNQINFAPLSLTAPTVQAMTITSAQFPTATLRTNGRSDGARANSAGGNMSTGRALAEIGSPAGSAGDIHEVIVYNRVLSEAEIAQIEAELLARWAVPQDETIAILSGWPLTAANRATVTPTVQLYRNWTPLAEAGRPVSIVLASAGWVGNVSGLSAVTDANGTATLPALQIGATVGSELTITVRATGSTAETTAPPLVVDAAGPATTLAFATAPLGPQQIGVPITPTPVVDIRDANGNPVEIPDVVVTAARQSGTAATLTGTTAVTDAHGRATFPSLTLFGTAGSRVLRFSADGLTGVNTESLSYQVGPTASIATITAPSPVFNTSGQVLRTQPVVEFRDAANNATSAVNGGTAMVVPISSGLTVSAGGSVVISSNRATFTTLTFTASSIGEYSFQIVETSTWVTSAPFIIDLDGGNGFQNTLKEWVRADQRLTATSGVVTQWLGFLSGNSYTLSGSPPWSATGLAGRPAVTFNGATAGHAVRALATGGTAADATVALVAVVPATRWAPSTWRDVAQVGATGSTTSGSHYTMQVSGDGAVRCVTPLTSGTTHTITSAAGVIPNTTSGAAIVTCRRSNTNFLIEVNGVEALRESNVATATTVTGNLRIGRGQLTLTSGAQASTVGEVLVFTPSLSSTNLEIVYASLKARWNIP